MKMLSLILVLTFSASLLAETCFIAAKEIPVESKIPQIFCVNSYSLELITPGFPKVPHYLATVDTTLGTIAMTPKFHRDSNLVYEVKVSKLVAENYTGSCESSLLSWIVVGFKVDEKGNELDVEPTVSAHIETKTDTCHSAPEAQEIIFNRI